MPWLKIQRQFGWGRGDVEWREVTDNSRRIVRETRLEIEEQEDSHMFRDVTVEAVDVPPRWVIEHALAAATENFRELEDKIARLDHDAARASDCPTCGPHPVIPYHVAHGMRVETCETCGRHGVCFEAKINNPRFTSHTDHNTQKES